MMCCLLYIEQLNAICKSYGHLAITAILEVSGLFMGSGGVSTMDDIPPEQ